MSGQISLTAVDELAAGRNPAGKGLVLTAAVAAPLNVVPHYRVIAISAVDRLMLVAVASRVLCQMANAVIKDRPVFLN